MDLQADLAHGYDTPEDLAYHYQGPVRQVLSDDGTTYLYYVVDGDGNAYALVHLGVNSPKECVQN
jgi:hypothetical protein